MKNASSRIPKPLSIVFVAVSVVALGSLALFRMSVQPQVIPAATSTLPSASTQQAYPIASATPLPTIAPTMIFRVLPTTDPRTIIFPTPAPLPTSTPTHVLSPTPVPSLTPIQPITAWLVYTNTTYGYTVAYPNTWRLEVSDASNVFITSYQTTYFRGTGAVKIDLLASTQNYSETVRSPQPVCVDGVCGIRIDDRGPFSSPAAGGIHRVIGLRFQHESNYYIVSAAIQDPPADADRNAVIVEQIMSTFHFTR